MHRYSCLKCLHCCCMSSIGNRKQCQLSTLNREAKHFTVCTCDFTVSNSVLGSLEVRLWRKDVFFPIFDFFVAKLLGFSNNMLKVHIFKKEAWLKYFRIRLFNNDLFPSSIKNSDTTQSEEAIFTSKNTKSSWPAILLLFHHYLPFN